MPLRRNLFCSPRSQMQIKFWNKNSRRTDQVLTILTNLCPYPQGKCTSWIFIGRNRKDILKTFLVRRQMQNAGLLAGVQLCRVTRSELLVKSCGYKLRHNDNVNQNISLSHHLLYCSMPWKYYVRVCVHVFKVYLDISDRQVLPVLWDPRQGRCVLKYQSESSNSLLSSKIQAHTTISTSVGNSIHSIGKSDC